MCHKPKGVEWLEGYPECAEKFKKVVWFGLCEKMKGFNNEVAEEFAKRFEGYIVELGSLKFQVTKEYIVVAVSLPMDGEKWFKNKGINVDYNRFLKA